MQIILHDRKYRQRWQVWHVHSIQKKSCWKMISTVGCDHDLLVEVRAGQVGAGDREGVGVEEAEEVVVAAATVAAIPP